MKICPTCRHCYEDADASCAQAGHGGLVPSRPGPRLIADKYRLDKLLGRGGMGAVYAGTHVDLRRPTAVKLLLPDLVTDPQALERFKREARAAGRLNHPNVASTYDYGTLPGGESYIIMELVEGETLRERLGAAGALPAAEALLVARQIADGIESAHRVGIVHRDLKPSNIIVSRDHHDAPFVKVLDFGVAKLKEHSTGALDAVTGGGGIVGTPRYMSPEQCADAEVDARSDIYSLGVILYEMLAGRAPFDAPSATALALKHIKEPPPPLGEARPDVPDALARLVARALAKDPAERPQTAAEFSRALREAELSVASQDVKGDGEQAASTAGPAVLKNVAAVQRQTDVGPAARPADLPSEAGTRKHAEALPSRAVEALPEPAPRPRSRGWLRLALVMAGVFLVSGIGTVILLRWRSQPTPASTHADAPTAAAPSPPTPQAATTPDGASAVPEATPAGQPPAQEKQDAAQTTETHRKALQSSLAAWVAATNSRDVKRQLAFYAPRLGVFYLSRNVSRDAVLDEKRNTFGRAERVSISVGDPTINVSRDGLTAVMKFRKRYVIESGGKRRTGEVLQELQWSKSKSDKSGWRITGERDLQVLR